MVCTLIFLAGSTLRRTFGTGSPDGIDGQQSNLSEPLVAQIFLKPSFGHVLHNVQTLLALQNGQLGHVV